MICSGVSAAISVLRQVSPGCLVLCHPHRPCTDYLAVIRDLYVLLVLQLEVEIRNC